MTWKASSATFAGCTSSRLRSRTRVPLVGMISAVRALSCRIESRGFESSVSRGGPPLIGHGCDGASHRKAFVGRILRCWPQHAWKSRCLHYVRGAVQVVPCLVIVLQRICTCGVRLGASRVLRVSCFHGACATKRFVPISQASVFWVAVQLGSSVQL